MKKDYYSIVCAFFICLTLPAAAQKITHVYSGTLKCNVPEKADSIKKDFSDLLGKAYYVNIGESARPRFLHEDNDKGVIVSRDTVSFNLTKKEKYALVCSDKQEIKIQEYSYLGKVYQIVLPGLTVYWKNRDLELAKRFADDIVYFQNLKDLVPASDIEDFELIAAKYRSLTAKPVLSEEARKFIVQANAMTQTKDYKKAIEYYNKAIRVEPANPMAYNNQALLYAMIGQYKDAINCMKKYLKLAPDASDARAVQDKIYEWEAMMNK